MAKKSRSKTKQPLAIVSADKEIIEMAKELPQFRVIGFFDLKCDSKCLGIPALGNDEDWPGARKKVSSLQIAMAIDPPQRKKQLTEHYGQKSLATLISPAAYISPSASVGKGCLVQRGVEIMSEARLGIACKINVRAVVHHDCKVGDYCTVAPGAFLLGNVVLEDEVFVGAGAIILPRVKVGKGAVIGAGAVVTEDVSAHTTVAGVPARKL